MGRLLLNFFKKWFLKCIHAPECEILIPRSDSASKQVGMPISAELHLVRSGLCCTVELIFHMAIAFPHQLSPIGILTQCPPVSPEIRARGSLCSGATEQTFNPKIHFFVCLKKGFCEFGNPVNRNNRRTMHEPEWVPRPQSLTLRGTTVVKRNPRQLRRNQQRRGYCL